MLSFSCINDLLFFCKYWSILRPFCSGEMVHVFLSFCYVIWYMSSCIADVHENILTGLCKLTFSGCIYVEQNSTIIMCLQQTVFYLITEIDNVLSWSLGLHMNEVDLGHSTGNIRASSTFDASSIEVWWCSFLELNLILYFLFDVSFCIGRRH